MINDKRSCHKNIWHVEYKSVKYDKAEHCLLPWWEYKLSADQLADGIYGIQ